VARQAPANKLTEEEYNRILEICHSPEFSEDSPDKIVPKLADEGRYIASESTFYRVLRSAKEAKRRGRNKQSIKKNPPESYIAEASCEVWSWDITWLPGPVKGLFFYLYMIMDIYSRKIVGWEVYENEKSELAASVLHKAVLRERCIGTPVVLHSDNGSPMKGNTMLEMMSHLDIKPSRNRPGVSNDNPYSESLFHTLKYCPAYPEKGFRNIEESRQWVKDFTDWYNDCHLHSGISFVTPNQRHTGQDFEILRKRKEVYEAAKSVYPKRWSGETRNWTHKSQVKLNPLKSKEIEEQKEIVLVA
jgi:transposase InsO family protein